MESRILEESEQSLRFTSLEEHLIVKEFPNSHGVSNDRGISHNLSDSNLISEPRGE